MSNQPNQPNSEQPPQGRREIPKLQPSGDSGEKQHDQVPRPLGDVQHPNRRNSQTEDGLRRYFMRNLDAERRGEYTPGENSADPVVRDEGQPPVRPPQNTPRQPEQRVEDINQPGVSQPPAEQPTGQTEGQPEPIQQAQEGQQLEGQPEPLGEQYGFEIDGEFYTETDVRNLINESKQKEFRQEDYSRKTQYLSRVRQESEALGTSLTEFQKALERKAQLIGQVVDANVNAYRNIDPNTLDQEGFASYKQQLQAAEQGRAQLLNAFKQADEEAARHDNDAFARTSGATLEMLRWHEPRWDKENTFYGQLRQFAVEEGLMTDEAFTRENDFLRMVGLIALMDRHNLPETIRESTENPRPPERTHNAPQRGTDGKFTTSVQNTQRNVLESPNARKDGSLHSHFMAKLQDERRRGVQPQQR